MAKIPKATLLSISGPRVIPGKYLVRELFFEVPKDYSNPDLGTLRLFARSVTNYEKPATPVSAEDEQKQLQKPYMVFLQGGPGGACRPPQDAAITKPILDRGYQMLYLDQRGTGLSSTITSATLALQGDAKKQADYLKLFRADNIVRDCEAVRKSLTHTFPQTGRKWSLFGQSFGGFCAFTYLSKYPEGLREVFTSGGVPPISKIAEEVYKATYRRVIERNQAYYKKFPSDIKLVKQIVAYLGKSADGEPIRLPTGGMLTSSGFLSMGIAFGGAGGIDVVHDVSLRANEDLTNFGFLTRPTLSTIESIISKDDGIIYAILHEAIYQGYGQASAWAANRVGKGMSEFQWLNDTTLKGQNEMSQPIYFTGEMIYPFMFDDSSELQNLKEVANILAEYTDWPDLYDEEQLAKNEVPVYAATFCDDMYVDYNLVQQTVSRVGSCKQFITNTMYHSAIRSNTADVLKALFALRDDTID